MVNAASVLFVMHFFEKRRSERIYTNEICDNLMKAFIKCNTYDGLNLKKFPVSTNNKNHTVVIANCEDFMTTIKTHQIIFLKSDESNKKYVVPSNLADQIKITDTTYFEKSDSDPHSIVCTGFELI
jgi:hypothetical protein